MTQPHPPAWPEGWARTPPSKRVDGRYQFRRRKAGGEGPEFWTHADARDSLLAAAVSIGAPVFTIDAAEAEDGSIVAAFQVGARRIVMACDRFTRPEENMRAIATAIEALRQLERAGGSAMLERALGAFAAPPAAPT